MNLLKINGIVLEDINYKKIFLIVGISVVFGVVYNILSPKSLPFMIDRPKLVYSGSEDSSGSSNQIKAIRLAKAVKLYDDGVTFIDARDIWDFADGHIKFAINIPEYDFEDYADKVSALDKYKTYVIYCGGDDCDVSQRLSKKMAPFGFKELLVFVGGWKEWNEAKMPIEIPGDKK